MYLESQRSFDMQQTVRLLDDLGERYGSEHVYFNLRSPAEAIKLLCINHPALQKEMTQAHQHGVGYTLVQAGTFLGYEDLQLPLGKNDLVLSPVIAGSGGSTTRILAGVGLVAFSIVTAGTGAGFLNLGAGLTGFTLNSAASVALGSIGASLVLGGISQLLSPLPRNLDGRTRPGENTNALGPQGVSRATSGRQSYAFSGPVNTVGVGATVPLVYGKVLIGSHLLSSRVDITDESNPTGTFFGITGPRSITINGNKPVNEMRVHNGLRTRIWYEANVDLRGPSSSTKDDDFIGLDSLKPDDIEINFASSKGRNFVVGGRGVESLEVTTNENRENLFVLFELNGGLFNTIGGQTVPAFVTYEIQIKKKDYPGEDPVAAVVRGTIQGLLKKTQKYRFAHAITYATLGEERLQTSVQLNVRIIDTDAVEENGGKFIVRGYGYNQFVVKEQNRTQALLEAEE